MKKRTNINFKLEKDIKVKQDRRLEPEDSLYKIDNKISNETINNFFEKIQDINATNKLISSIAIV